MLHFTGEPGVLFPREMEGDVVEYREIHGYKYIYRACDEGFVEMLWKKGEWKRLKERKSIRAGKGNPQYMFRFAKKEGGVCYRSAKKVIWEAFRGPVPEGWQVSGRYSSSDCSLSNLFLTRKGDNGRWRYRRPVAMYDRKGNVVAVYSSVKEAAEKNYMSPLAVRRRCNRKMKDPFLWYDYDFRYDDGNMHTGNIDGKRGRKKH